MACYHPVSIGHETTFPFRDRLVSCGRCLGCLLRRARDWTVRCSHELSLHDDAMFLTLTYTDEQLPFNQLLPSLCPPHLVRFFKRYRKALSPRKISFFACGEYGTRTSRPHYHAIVFGHRFPDLRPFTSRNGNTLLSSPELSRIWSHGQVVVGEVTPESIAYVARYTVDKLHSRVSDPDYVASGRVPEYVTMSRRPSIGRRFYEKYYKQFLVSDSVSVSPGFNSSLPRYYDKLYSKYFGYLDDSDCVLRPDSILDSVYPSVFSPELIKARRIEQAALRAFDNFQSRRDAKEEVARAKLRQAPSRVF